MRCREKSERSKGKCNVIFKNQSSEVVTTCGSLLTGNEK